MKQRDLELLSSYLDGQLSSSDATRLEARLLTDPELRSVLRDLRSARSVLRQLPMRKAPRNFTLTPQMVGKNPPLPRAYPAFRLTTALATLLLFISFGLNFLRPQLASAQYPFGMGGGGAPDTTLSAESAPAAQAPVATEAPAATQAPAATEAPTEAPNVAMAPMATTTAAAVQDTTRSADTAVAKNTEPAIGMGGGLEQPPVPPVRALPVISPALQWIFAGVAILSAFIMALMRQLSINRWRKKN
jgi:anti-sigma factor RsiW